MGLFEVGAQSVLFLTVLLLEPVDQAGEDEDDRVGRVRPVRLYGGANLCAQVLDAGAQVWCA